jgi:hypothetical protein
LNGDDETATDKFIREEVAKFLEAEEMSEANLVKLDKRLADVLTGSATGGPKFNYNASRGSMAAQPYINDNHYQSTASQRSKPIS